MVLPEHGGITEPSGATALVEKDLLTPLASAVTFESFETTRAPAIGSGQTTAPVSGYTRTGC